MGGERMLDKIRQLAGVEPTSRPCSTGSPGSQWASTSGSWLTSSRVGPGLKASPAPAPGLRRWGPVLTGCPAAGMSAPA